MNEKTREWRRIILSMLVFNLIIGVFIWVFDIISAYTFTLKILLDIAVGFVTDKSIKYFSASWRDGFVIQRE